MPGVADGGMPIGGGTSPPCGGIPPGGGIPPAGGIPPIGGAPAGGGAPPGGGAPGGGMPAPGGKGGGRGGGNCWSSSALVIWSRGSCGGYWPGGSIGAPCCGMGIYATFLSISASKGRLKRDAAHCSAV